MQQITPRDHPAELNEWELLSIYQMWRRQNLTIGEIAKTIGCTEHCVFLAVDEPITECYQIFFNNGGVQNASDHSV